MCTPTPCGSTSEAWSSDGRVEQVGGHPRHPRGVRPSCSVHTRGWTRPGRATTGSSPAPWPACSLPGRTPAGRRSKAGRAWGSQLTGADDAHADSGTVVTDGQATGRLVALLDDLGFAPERDPARAGTIGLRHCPFLDLVPEHAGVICPLHLGLMQGALDALGAGITVTRLEPFASADLCLAHTGPAEPAS